MLFLLSTLLSHCHRKAIFVSVMSDSDATPRSTQPESISSGATPSIAGGNETPPDIELDRYGAMSYEEFMADAHRASSFATLKAGHEALSPDERLNEIFQIMLTWDRVNGSLRPVLLGERIYLKAFTTSCPCFQQLLALHPRASNDSIRRQVRLLSQPVPGGSKRFL